MEFIQGQVFNMGKLTDYIKKSKEKKHSALITQRSLQDFFDICAEYEHLKTRIEHSYEGELLHADIYRLKAAQIMQNYYIKAAKEQHKAHTGGQL